MTRIPNSNRSSSCTRDGKLGSSRAERQIMDDLPVEKLEFRAGKDIPQLESMVGQ